MAMEFNSNPMFQFTKVTLGIIKNMETGQWTIIQDKSTKDIGKTINFMDLAYKFVEKADSKAISMRIWRQDLEKSNLKMVILIKVNIN